MRRNPLLDVFVQSNIGAAGIIQELQDAYIKKMYDATLSDDFQPQHQDAEVSRVEQDSSN